MKIIPILYLRVTAMIMVVALHSLCYYGNWGFKYVVVKPFLELSSFLNDIAMPLFMCISGYLFVKSIYTKKNIDFKSFIKGKFNRLMIPYIVWGGGIQIVLMPDRYSIRQLIFGVSHLWFLLTLFLIFLIMFIYQDRWKNASLKQYVLFIIFLFALYPISKYTHNILRIASVVKYLPYFMIGIMVFKNYTIKNKLFKKVVFVTSLVGLFLIKFVFNDALSDALSFDLCQILGWLFVYVLFDLSLKLKLPDLKIIDFLDNMSMGIYIIHHIVIIYCLQFVYVRNFLNEYWRVGPLVIFIIAFFSSMILTYIMKKNKTMKMLIG